MCVNNEKFTCSCTTTSVEQKQNIKYQNNNNKPWLGLHRKYTYEKYVENWKYPILFYPVLLRIVSCRVPMYCTNDHLPCVIFTTFLPLKNFLNNAGSTDDDVHDSHYVYIIRISRKCLIRMLLLFHKFLFYVSE